MHLVSGPLKTMNRLFFHKCLTATVTVTRLSPCVYNRNVDSTVVNTRDVSRRINHQRLQFRYFDSRKVRKRKKSKNPFLVLKIKKGALYKDVKAKFLKIAMSNHPDTHSDDISEKEKEIMRDKFIEARIAFESLTENSDGIAVLLAEKEDEETRMSNFNSWFHGETGHKNPFDVDIDPATMNEVAKMTEAMGGDQGLDRDGGSK